MGYRIVYGEGPGRKFGTGRGKFRLWLWIGCFVLLFLLLTNLFWPEGRAALWEFCIPGGVQAAAQALDSMAGSLRDGEKLGQAVTAFCQEIMQNAESAS